VANKGLRRAKSVRVANTGLKVVGFATSCAVFVRVARKGLTGKERRPENSERRERIALRANMAFCGTAGTAPKQYPGYNRLLVFVKR
jgi:hypothetical protein